VGLRWLLRDITELKQAEEQLRYQAALLAMSMSHHRLRCPISVDGLERGCRVPVWLEGRGGPRAERLEIVRTEWPVQMRPRCGG